jgi:hypothetical protein
MEPAVAAIGSPQDPIETILSEAERLTRPRIIELARGYPRDPSERQARSHLLELAARRARRQADVRRLKAEAAAAVQRSARARGLEPWISLLGGLTDAELAVQDAVLALFLSDRLGSEQVDRLSQPWRTGR